MDPISPINVQILAAILLALGLGAAVSRRNLFFVLMGVELMLNAANLSFIGFSRTLPATSSLQGQIAPLFSIAVAAAEACVGLAMMLSIFRRRESLDTDTYSDMKE